MTDNRIENIITKCWRNQSTPIEFIKKCQEYLRPPSVQEEELFEEYSRKFSESFINFIIRNSGFGKPSPTVLSFLKHALSTKHIRRSTYFSLFRNHVKVINNPRLFRFLFLEIIEPSMIQFEMRDTKKEEDLFGNFFHPFNSTEKVIHLRTFPPRRFLGENEPVEKMETDLHESQMKVLTQLCEILMILVDFANETLLAIEEEEEEEDGEEIEGEKKKRKMIDEEEEYMNNVKIENFGMCVANLISFLRNRRISTLLQTAKFEVNEIFMELSRKLEDLYVSLSEQLQEDQERGFVELKKKRRYKNMLRIHHLRAILQKSYSKDAPKFRNVFIPPITHYSSNTPYRPPCPHPVLSLFLEYEMIATDIFSPRKFMTRLKLIRHILLGKRFQYSNAFSSLSHFLGMLLCTAYQRYHCFETVVVGGSGGDKMSQFLSSQQSPVRSKTQKSPATPFSVQGSRESFIKHETLYKQLWKCFLFKILRNFRSLCYSEGIEEDDEETIHMIILRGIQSVFDFLKSIKIQPKMNGGGKRKKKRRGRKKKEEEEEEMFLTRLLRICYLLDLLSDKVIKKSQFKDVKTLLNRCNKMAYFKNVISDRQKLNKNPRRLSATLESVIKDTTGVMFHYWMTEFYFGEGEGGEGFMRDEDDDEEEEDGEEEEEEEKAKSEDLECFLLSKAEFVLIIQLLKYPQKLEIVRYFGLLPEFLEKLVVYFKNFCEKPSEEISTHSVIAEREFSAIFSIFYLTLERSTEGRPEYQDRSSRKRFVLSLLKKHLCPPPGTGSSTTSTNQNMMKDEVDDVVLRKKRILVNWIRGYLDNSFPDQRILIQDPLPKLVRGMISCSYDLIEQQYHEQIPKCPILKLHFFQIFITHGLDCVQKMKARIDQLIMALEYLLRTSFEYTEIIIFIQLLEETQFYYRNQRDFQLFQHCLKELVNNVVQRDLPPSMMNTPTTTKGRRSRRGRKKKVEKMKDEEEEEEEEQKPDEEVEEEKKEEEEEKKEKKDELISPVALNLNLVQPDQEEEEEEEEEEVIKSTPTSASSRRNIINEMTTKHEEIVKKKRVPIYYVIGTAALYKIYVRMNLLQFPAMVPVTTTPSPQTSKKKKKNNPADKHKSTFSIIRKMLYFKFRRWKGVEMLESKARLMKSQKKSKKKKRGRKKNQNQTQQQAQQQQPFTFPFLPTTLSPTYGIAVQMMTNAESFGNTSSLYDQLLDMTYEVKTLTKLRNIRLNHFKYTNREKKYLDDLLIRNYLFDLRNWKNLIFGGDKEEKEEDLKTEDEEKKKSGMRILKEKLEQVNLISGFLIHQESFTDYGFVEYFLNEYIQIVFSTKGPRLLSQIYDRFPLIILMCFTILYEENDEEEENENENENEKINKKNNQIIKKFLKFVVHVFEQNQNKYLEKMLLSFFQEFSVRLPKLFRKLVMEDHLEVASILMKHNLPNYGIVLFDLEDQSERKKFLDYSSHLL